MLEIAGVSVCLCACMRVAAAVICPRAASHCDRQGDERLQRLRLALCTSATVIWVTGIIGQTNLGKVDLFSICSHIQFKLPRPDEHARIALLRHFQVLVLH